MYLIVCAIFIKANNNSSYFRKVQEAKLNSNLINVSKETKLTYLNRVRFLLWSEHHKDQRKCHDLHKYVCISEERKISGEIVTSSWRLLQLFLWFCIIVPVII